jgi:hypothetical protein
MAGGIHVEGHDLLAARRCRRPAPGNCFVDVFGGDRLGWLLPKIDAS